MPKRVGTTITEHILNQQRENPEATGAFTYLMNELIVAAKVISREVNKAGLGDVLGAMRPQSYKYSCKGHAEKIA